MEMRLQSSAGLAMNAVVYRRVSTQEQGEHGRSLETQERRCREYCQQRGYTVVGVYTDVQSGRRDDRPQYRAMLARIAQGGIDVVVVQWLDRFGRKPREILRRYYALEEQGVRIEATDEDIRDELILLVKVGVAGHYVKQTGQRIKAVLSDLHDRGNWVTQYPLGYTLDPTTRRLVVVEDEACVVRLIYQWYRDGLGYEEIAKRLNLEGYRGKRGRPFWPASIKKILTNPVYAGHSTRRDIWRYQTHNPIIPPADWADMQRLVAYRSHVRTPRYPDRPFPLAGLVKCARCGRWLYTWMPQHRTQKRRPQRFYRCGGNKTGLCRLPIISANVVERWLQREALNWQYDPTDMPVVDPDVPSIGSLERDLARVRERQQRNHRSYVNGFVDDAEFERVARDLKAEAERIQAQLAEAEAVQRRLANREATLQQIRNFYVFWRLCAEDGRWDAIRNALREFVECIEVEGNREFRLVFRPEFAFLAHAHAQE